MSRGGAATKRQVDAGLTDKIPLKPEAVVAYEETMLERREAVLFAYCRSAAWKGSFPVFRSPEAWGASFANGVFDQMLRNALGQSQIVVPR